MDIELKKIIEDLGTAFAAFKVENDKRLADIEKSGHADPLLAEKVDKINADMAKILVMKKQLEDLEKTVSRGGLGGDGDLGMSNALKQHAKAFDKWFRKGVESGLADLEVKANLSTLSDPDGGFTVPEEVEAAIDRVAATVSAMRRLATVRTIGTDEYKKLVNQGGASSGWVAEKGSRAETDTPTLVEIAINTKEIYAMPAATQKLLDDSRINIANWLAEEVSIEFAEQESDAFIDGNGVEKPKGILAYSTVANASYAWGKVGYIVTGEASVFNDADKLIDLQHALKSVYRNGAGWLMNDATMAHIRKFKDGEGNYIWRPGLAEGAPETIFGKPVEIDDNMPDIAAGKFPIAFANFARAYLIIDRFGIRVLRDPYSSKPYVLFYTTRRVGGGIVMYEAIKLLKVSA
jgi:HK97 family phage major capsid protein